MEEKRVLCASCDISCSVVAQLEDGRVVKIRTSDNPAFKGNLCPPSSTAAAADVDAAKALTPLEAVGMRSPGGRGSLGSA